MYKLNITFFNTVVNFDIENEVFIACFYKFLKNKLKQNQDRLERAGDLLLPNYGPYE